MALVDGYSLDTPELPPQRGQLYDYVAACNGLFIRASRPGLRVVLPIRWEDMRIDMALEPGVYPLETKIEFDYPPVPQVFVWAMLEMARRNVDDHGETLEKLFHIVWDAEVQNWHVYVPAQTQTVYSVQPLDQGSDSSYVKALIEIHSHHRLGCFFSHTDDADEVGFRVYGVMGDIYDDPQIRLRIGVYGVWHDIPATSILELPAYLSDRVERNQALLGEEEGTYVIAD